MCRRPCRKHPVILGRTQLGEEPNPKSQRCWGGPDAACPLPCARWAPARAGSAGLCVALRWHLSAHGPRAGHAWGWLQPSAPSACGRPALACVQRAARGDADQRGRGLCSPRRAEAFWRPRGKALRHCLWSIADSCWLLR